MWITKKAMEEKIARAVTEAREHEAEKRWQDERFERMMRRFDEMEKRLYRLEAKENGEVRIQCETAQLSDRL